MEDRKALEIQVEIRQSQLETEEIRGNVVDEVVVWLRKKGIVRVVDKVVESA